MGVLSIAGLSFLRWFANRFSIEATSNMGAYIGRKFGPFTKRHLRALQNLKRALPQYSDKEYNDIASGMWDNFGRTVAESLVLPRIAEDPERVVLENAEELDFHGDDSKQGTVFVGLHFGNWESTVIPASRMNLELLGLYKESKNDQFNAWLHKHRSSLYPAGLMPGNPSTLLKITKHVKKGGAVCLLGDHTDPSGLHVDFFGDAAPSTAVPAMLSVRLGARLIAARVDRLNDAKFSVYLKPIAVPFSGDQKTDILETTKKLQSVFEEWIAEDPDKWLWFYKRWPESRKRPTRTFL